uniref:Uncharacterized protein n=1 Tax=Glossina brevipalpis TaxID=37001 RepID=A0A1A9WW41_9MUSC
MRTTLQTVPESLPSDTVSNDGNATSKHTSSVTLSGQHNTATTVTNGPLTSTTTNVVSAQQQQCMTGSQSAQQQLLLHQHNVNSSVQSVQDSHQQQQQQQQQHDSTNANTIVLPSTTTIVNTVTTSNNATNCTSAIPTSLTNANQAPVNNSPSYSHQLAIAAPHQLQPQSHHCHVTGNSIADVPRPSVVSNSSSTSSNHHHHHHHGGGVVGAPIIGKNLVTGHSNSSTATAALKQRTSSSTKVRKIYF